MEENVGRDIDAAPEESAEGLSQPDSQPVEQEQASLDDDAPEDAPAAEAGGPESAADEGAPEPLVVDESIDGEPAEDTTVEQPIEEEPVEEPTPEEGAPDTAEAIETAEAAGEEPIARVESAEPQGADDMPVAPVTKARIPWWPYLVYLAAWIGVVGAAFYVISYQPDALPAFKQDNYPYILLAGLVLTVCGPLLSFLVWLIKWLRSPKDERGGLLTAALVKGALVTFLGVLVWWGAIIMLDAIRLGMIDSII